jgi:hypothetical protein
MFLIVSGKAGFCFLPQGTPRVRKGFFFAFIADPWRTLRLRLFFPHVFAKDGKIPRGLLQPPYFNIPKIYLVTVVGKQDMPLFNLPIFRIILKLGAGHFFFKIIAAPLVADHLNAI